MGSFMLSFRVLVESTHFRIFSLKPSVIFSGFVGGMIEDIFVTGVVLKSIFELFYFVFVLVELIPQLVDCSLVLLLFEIELFDVVAKFMLFV